MARFIQKNQLVRRQFPKNQNRELNHDIRELLLPEQGISRVNFAPSHEPRCESASGSDADRHAKLLGSLIWARSSVAPNHIFRSGIRTLTEAASQSFEADLFRTGADEIAGSYDIRRRTI